MKDGETGVIDFPIPDGFGYPPPGRQNGARGVGDEAMYGPLLQEHLDDLRACGLSPQPPCGSAELQRLRERASKELGAELPHEYYDFLQLTNGLDSNRLVIYASRSLNASGHGQRTAGEHDSRPARAAWWYGCGAASGQVRRGARGAGGGHGDPMSKLSLEIVVDWMKLPVGVVWDRLYSSHRQYLDEVGEVEVDSGGEPCPARDVAKRIERSGGPHFGVAWSDDQRLDYGPVTNYELSFVTVEGCVRDEEDAEAWLAPFLADEAFRQARLFDEEYNHWQNAKDPIQYTTVGRSYEGLPMKPNGPPPPLDRMEIDISRNPGRRVLRRGFIEAVGCPMWLGESFWSITGASREVICAESSLRCETRPGNVVRLRPADAPFTTAEGKAGELQDRLRVLLYPRVGDTHALPAP